MKQKWRCIHPIIFLMALLFLGGWGCHADDAKIDMIKNDFCGIYIKTQYCQCAFENDMCDEIDMRSGQAQSFVFDEYEKWKQHDVVTK